jgi:hypothetical protein
LEINIFNHQVTKTPKSNESGKLFSRLPGRDKTRPPVPPALPSKASVHRTRRIASAITFPHAIIGDLHKIMRENDYKRMTDFQGVKNEVERMSHFSPAEHFRFFLFVFRNSFGKSVPRVFMMLQKGKRESANLGRKAM